MQYETAWLDAANGSETLVDSGTRKQARPGHGVFLAHAFSGLLSPEGEFDPEARAKLEYLISGFRAGGYAVHCALEREDWGARLMSPTTALKLDIDQVGKASHLVSFPQGSPGAFFELGFRVGNWGPTLLLRDASATADELYHMRRAIRRLQTRDIPSALIEDTAPDQQTFETSTAAQIIAWVAENPAP